MVGGWAHLASWSGMGKTCAGSLDSPALGPAMVLQMATLTRRLQRCVHPSAGLLQAGIEGRPAAF
jgi:hypothetical protein